MTAPDLNNLRAILEEYDRYSHALSAGDRAKAGIADEMRGVIAEARRALHPSADGTANFVDTRQIVERLNALRARAEAS